MEHQHCPAATPGALDAAYPAASTYRGMVARHMTRSGSSDGDGLAMCLRGVDGSTHAWVRMVPYTEAAGAASAAACVGHIHTDTTAKTVALFVGGGVGWVTLGSW